MRSPELIIKRPLLTEKGTRLKDTGGRAEEDIDDPEQVPPQLLSRGGARRQQDRDQVTPSRSCGT